jgi:hypothetical protein
MLVVISCVAALALLPSLAVAHRDAGVPTSTKCTGSITRSLAGRLVRASSIRVTKVSCTAGKDLLRAFYKRASSSASCRGAANKPAPATGCVVSGYHCFRKRDPDYCTTLSGKLVQWRETHGVAGKPPR